MRIVSFRAAVEQLDRLVLLDAAPSSLPITAPQPTDAELKAEYAAYRAYQNINAIYHDPNIEHESPTYMQAISQAYYQYLEALAGTRPPAGPSYVPDAPGTSSNPLPMDPDIVDQIIQEILAGPPPDPGMPPASPVTVTGPDPGSPPYVYDPINPT